MFNTLLEIIFAVESQDLIADVTILEDKFNEVLNSIKKLSHKEQQQIVAHIYTVVYTKQKSPTKCWNNLTELRDYFFALARQHKIARAKDAGEKILHAMHKVLLLETPEEFSAMQVKYATNHHEHAKDVATRGERDAKQKFAEEIAPVKGILDEAVTAATEQVRLYNAEIEKLNAELEKAKLINNEEGRAAVASITQEKEKFTRVKESLEQAIKAVTDTKELINADDPTTLQNAFGALVALKQKDLALKADPQSKVDAAVAAVAKAKEDVAAAQKAKDKADAAAAADNARDLIIEAFRNFAGQPDKAIGTSNLISHLDNSTLKREIGVQLAKITDSELNARVIREVRMAVGAMEVSHDVLGTDKVQIPAVDATLDVVADSLKAQKAVARAKSAGEMIVKAFTDVGTTAEAELPGLVNTYRDNHNMHVLNVLEHTAEGDKLREVMFAAMEKALPFERNVIRNLNLLQQKFAELVQARIME